MAWLSQILPVATVLAAAALVVGQCRKPRGWVGRLHIWLMNRRHAGLTAWGLGHVRIEPAFAILDVGCGGGKAVERLAALASQGRVYGVDYSAASVAAASGANAGAIAGGRVEIRQASVSSLPFDDNTFDLVTAVETHYYWPDPIADLREILRVLKPGGHLAIIAETYREPQAFGALTTMAMALLGARHLSVDEHASAGLAGFTAVAVNTDVRGDGSASSAGTLTGVATTRAGACRIEGEHAGKAEHEVARVTSDAAASDARSARKMAPRTREGVCLSRHACGYRRRAETSRSRES